MSNTFQQLMDYDRGGGIDPFSALRMALPGQLFGQADIFGKQGAGFLNSRGMFDPNMAEAIRLRAFGGAQSALAKALAELAGGEATFKEDQRRFNVGTDIQLADLSEQLKASKPGALDWITGLAQLGIGIGSFGTAGGFGAIGSGVGWLAKLFGGDKDGAI